MNEKFRVGDKIICHTKDDETTEMIGIIARFCSLSYEPDRRSGHNHNYARLQNGFTVKLIDCEPYTKITTYCLFEGRHDLPTNRGPICSEFDWLNNCVIRTPLWDELLENGGKLIVTGLTPALTEFLIEWRSNIDWLLVGVHENDYKPTPQLTLLHYNSSSKSYFEQQF